MGYRSEFVVALNANVIMESVISNNLPSLLIKADITKNIRCESGALNYKIYGSTGIKMYEGYNDVDKLHTFLDNLEDESYGFVRIGEDIGDTEEKGTPWDFDIQVNTYINSPLD